MFPGNGWKALILKWPCELEPSIWRCKVYAMVVVKTGAKVNPAEPRCCNGFPRLVAAEDILRADSMHSHLAVHELRDVYIDGDAYESIGVISAQVLLIN